MMQQTAKIIARDDTSLECVIECGDACAGCSARKVCANGSSDNPKTITLFSTNPAHKVGDTIQVEISSGMGLRAVLLAYLVPVALIVGIMLVMQALECGELLSAGVTLGVVALYFVAVKLLGWGRSIGVSIVEDSLS